MPLAIDIKSPNTSESIDQGVESAKPTVLVSSTRPPLKLRRLESVRGFAAIYVLFHHANKDLFGDRFSVLRFGQEAVMAFFLLSGFVIGYSSFSCTKFNVHDYVLKRIRRIYPLFLVALLIAYVTRCVSYSCLASVNFKLLLANLCMLQDSTSKPGGWFEPYYNPALWSISYECWFYLFFLIILSFSKAFVTQRLVAIAISGIGTLGYLFFPNQICTFAMYFIIWWAGAELAKEALSKGNLTWRQWPILVTLATFLAAWSIPVFRALKSGTRFGFGDPPFLEVRHMLASIALIVIALVWHRANWVGFNLLLGWAATLAPISYALYLVHSPILLAMPQGHYHPLLQLCFAIVLTAFLATPMERWLQPALNKWTNRYLTPNG